MVTCKFEFRDGNSEKFWQISRRGLSRSVRHGRIGTERDTNFDQSSRFPP